MSWETASLMPGGWGTMEEMFEMLTWSQLGLHTKPIGLLNVNGYYDALKALSDNMVQEGFLNEYVNASLLISDSIVGLLEQMDVYVARKHQNGSQNRRYRQRAFLEFPIICTILPASIITYTTCLTEQRNLS